MENQQLFTIVLDKLPQETTEQQIEDALKTSSFKYSRVARILQADFEKFGIESQLTLSRQTRHKTASTSSTNSAYFLVSFESRQDMNTLAHNILFEKTVKIANKNLHLKLHTKKGCYNSETSICIQQLNYACTENQIVEELNLVLRDERNKITLSRNNPEEAKDSSEQKDFILACIVFVDPISRQSKQFAFVDFSSKQAAAVAVKAWNENRMTKYPNRLSVALYDASHVKMSKEERERTKERPSYTNLYVEKLPFQFGRQDVLDLFSKYGPVVDVKLKKPSQSNVPLQSIYSMPCAAYVNFKEEADAQKAIQALNGSQVYPGSNELRVDFYQRANKFMGGLLGLDKKELITNTHFRVLFIRGIRKTVSREELKVVLTKYGTVETFTLKTKIEDGQVVSRGIAVVQYAEKDEAAIALRKLPFEYRALGDVDVDFYKSKESRMLEVEKKLNPLQQGINPMLLSALSAVRASHSRSPVRGHAVPAKNGKGSKRHNNNRSSLQNQPSTVNQQKPQPAKKPNQQSNKSEPGKDVLPKSQPKSSSIEKKSQPAQQAKKDEGSKAISSSQPAVGEKEQVGKDSKKKQPKSVAPKSAAGLVGSQPPPPVPFKTTQEKPAPAPLVTIPMDQFEACATEQDKKQFVGNYFYQFVLRRTEQQDPSQELAGKVTGMILEGQTIEYILYLCNNKDAFYSLVNEAITLIKTSEQ